MFRLVDKNLDGISFFIFNKEADISSSFISIPNQN